MALTSTTIPYGLPETGLPAVAAVESAGAPWIPAVPRASPLTKPLIM
jgi:hypothetical protein